MEKGSFSSGSRAAAGGLDLEWGLVLLWKQNRGDVVAFEGTSSRLSVPRDSEASSVYLGPSCSLEKT